jgi:peptidoglycan/LPS O-acetylase OafA/YrhL
MNDRFKELDSVRGIAVLLVIASHTFRRADYFTQSAFLHFITSLTSTSGIGVDMFFTLSGFLITSILLRTREHNHYLKNFYARRFLRIVPVYIFLIVVVIAFAPKLEEEFRSGLFKALPVFLLFQQNWIFVFLNIPMTMYLQVTWSLAVEEQFYFVWPFFVRRLDKKNLLKAAVGYIVLSILLRSVGIIFFENIGRASVDFFFYYNSFTRFEEMLVGALLAILLTYDELKEKIRKYSMPVFFISFSCFLVMAVLAPTYPKLLMVGGYTTVALFTAGLIAAFVSYPESAPIRRLFQNKVLFFFGKYSYSMYLFHLPVTLVIFDWLWRTGWRGGEVYVFAIVLVLAVTTVIALLTWNLIEKRMLSLKKYFEYQ